MSLITANHLRGAEAEWIREKKHPLLDARQKLSPSCFPFRSPVLQARLHLLPYRSSSSSRSFPCTRVSQNSYDTVVSDISAFTNSQSS